MEQSRALLWMMREVTPCVYETTCTKGVPGAISCLSEIAETRSMPFLRTMFFTAIFEKNSSVV